MSASQTETRTYTASPEGVFRELPYIHSLLRRDLKTVRRFADQVRDGGDSAAVVSEIRELETNSPLWQLKYGCMHYCRFVHGHHILEDMAMFPMIRKHDPSLDSVVDRLEEDHLTVHRITERIAAVSDAVATNGTANNRVELVAALTDLEQHLLDHLILEEDALGPILSG